MPVLQPKVMVRRVTDLDEEFFQSRGIRAVVLDVDNTLTTHGNPVPAPGIPEWIGRMKAAGLELTILSNNYRERVEPKKEWVAFRFYQLNLTEPADFVWKGYWESHPIHWIEDTGM